MGFFRKRQPAVALTQNKDVWSSLGILFDIQQLGDTPEGGYFTATKQDYCSVNGSTRAPASPSLLYQGDTQETLKGRARLYCIAVATKQSSALETIPKTFSAAKAQGFAASRFCEHPMDVEMDQSTGAMNPIHREPLPFWGRIDDNGTFLIAGPETEDVLICRKAGWKFRLPDKMESLLQQLHDDRVTANAMRHLSAEELSTLFASVDMERSNTPKIISRLRDEARSQGLEIVSGMADRLLEHPLWYREVH